MNANKREFWGGMLFFNHGNHGFSLIEIECFWMLDGEDGCLMLDGGGRGFFCVFCGKINIGSVNWMRGMVWNCC